MTPEQIAKRLAEVREQVIAQAVLSGRDMGRFIVWARIERHCDEALDEMKKHGLS
jgi:hypothetical protein